MHEKKRKKKTNIYFLHLVNFTEFRHFTYATTLFQVGEFAKIVLRAIGLFNLSRSRPFLSWRCLGHLSPSNVS